MSIEPDTKDWTWVLHRPCSECGFECAAVPVEAIAEELLTTTGQWEQILSHPCRDRPAPQTWSPLEYACHVRDVVSLGEVRVDLMLNEDDPLFANWDQDQTAAEQRYGDQDPGVVSDQIQQAAQGLSRRLDGLTGDQWQRTGRRSDGASFTVQSFARYLLHDLIHHEGDVRSPGSARPETVTGAS